MLDFFCLKAVFSYLRSQIWVGLKYFDGNICSMKLTFVDGGISSLANNWFIFKVKEFNIHVYIVQGTTWLLGNTLLKNQNVGLGLFENNSSQFLGIKTWLEWLEIKNWWRILDLLKLKYYFKSWKSKLVSKLDFSDETVRWLE